MRTKCSNYTAKFGRDTSVLATKARLFKSFTNLFCKSTAFHTTGANQSIDIPMADIPNKWRVAQNYADIPTRGSIKSKSCFRGVL